MDGSRYRVLAEGRLTGQPAMMGDFRARGITESRARGGGGFEFSRFSNFRNFERDVDRITGNRETGYEWDSRARGIAESRARGGVSRQLLWRQNGLGGVKNS